MSKHLTELQMLLFHSPIKNKEDHFNHNYATIYNKWRKKTEKCGCDFGLKKDSSKIKFCKCVNGLRRASGFLSQ